MKILPRNHANPSERRAWNIEVVVRKHSLKVKRSSVKTLIKKILDDLKGRPLPKQICELTVVFTNDSEIHKLNKKYRAKDKATDVLSFSHIENGVSAWEKGLGEIIISLDTTKKQAKEYKVTVQQELLRLLIHGTLHLFGYDHEKVSAKEASRMRNLEKKLYQRYAKATRSLISTGK